MVVLKIIGVYFKEMSIHSMCVYTLLPDISNISVEIVNSEYSVKASLYENESDNE